MGRIVDLPFDQSGLPHKVHYSGLEIPVSPDIAADLRRRIARIAHAVEGENTHDVVGITGMNLATGDQLRIELLIGPGIPIAIEGPR